MTGILDPSVVDRAGAHPRPGWRRRRVWMKVLAWLLAPLAVVVAAFQLQPTYIVLDIPVTKNPVGYLWWEMQRSELAYADEPGVLYVHRQVGTAYTATQGWRTAEEALAHFERWFLANGGRRLARASTRRPSRRAGSCRRRTARPTSATAARVRLRTSPSGRLADRWRGSTSCSSPRGRRGGVGCRGDSIDPLCSNPPLVPMPPRAPAGASVRERCG
jgi:hypothetical protein